MISEKRLEVLTRLFQSHYGLVVSVALRYAPNRDLVDDIVQQVYLDYVGSSSAEHWDLERSVAPLLFQITKRRAGKFWRSHCQNQRLSIDEVAEELLSGLEEIGTETHDILDDRIRALKHCLERLSPKSRANVEQHYFGGVSMKSLGEMQNMKTSAIHQFFCRVRSKLRDCIEQTLELEQT